MEQLDIYDVNRLKTGRTTARLAARQQSVEHGGYILVVHVCLFNSAGKMLIQQRQANKDKWPNMWDVSAAGAATAGDSSQLAAQRETAEELGLALDFSTIRAALTINFSFGFDDFYIVKRDVAIDQLVLQQSEVKAVRWAARGEILQLCEAGQFIPYRRSFINLLFDMAEQSGDVISTS